LKSAGIVLVICGAFLIYEVLHSRLRSLSGSGASSSGGGGGGSGSGGGGGGSSSTDSGVHSALGQDGQIYTVNSSYGSASDQEKDDMNRFAHQIGNVG